MTGTNCDLFTHNQSRSYLNHLVVLNVLWGGGVGKVKHSLFILISLSAHETKDMSSRI
jgi:hypothetical protein